MDILGDCDILVLVLYFCSVITTFCELVLHVLDLFSSAREMTGVTRHHFSINRTSNSTERIDITVIFFHISLLLKHHPLFLCFSLTDCGVSSRVLVCLERSDQPALVPKTRMVLPVTWMRRRRSYSCRFHDTQTHRVTVTQDILLHTHQKSHREGEWSC